MSEPPPQSLHIPVLLADVVRLLAPHPGESYLDLTAGYGGHAGAITERTLDVGKATLVDRDPQAIAALQPFKARGAEIIHAPFLDACTRLVQAGKHYDMILIDLGVSSPQLDRPERGFSFKAENAPLDMRMDQSTDTIQSLTAAHIANRWSEAELVRILAEYGEERPGRARAIAKGIVSARSKQTISFGKELADIVLSTHHGSWQRIHPATRTFQAFRIAVNDELGQLERTLPFLTDLLAKGGRIAIISFHSLEDRLVKQFLHEQSDSGYESSLKLLTKKAVQGSTNDVHNPRARSAMLRAAVKN